MKSDKNYAPLMVLGYFFMMNQFENSATKGRGSHWHSAESVREATVPYFRKKLAYRWIGGLLILFLVVMSVWCLFSLDKGYGAHDILGSNVFYLGITTLVSFFLYPALDPSNFISPEMAEMLDIRKVWDRKRRLFIESKFLYYLQEHFYTELSGATQICVNCLFYISDRRTGQMRQEVQEAILSALIRVAYDLHKVEVRKLLEEQIQAQRNVLSKLIKTLQELGILNSGITVGRAIQKSISKYGVYSGYKAHKSP